MGSDLPTIEFVGADGIRREHDYQRAPHAPWNALPRRARIGGRRDALRRGRAPTRAPRRRRARDGRDAGRRRSESLVTDRDRCGVESGFYVRPDSFSNVCCEPPARCDWAIGVSAPSSHTPPTAPCLLPTVAARTATIEITTDRYGSRSHLSLFPNALRQILRLVDRPPLLSGDMRTRTAAGTRRHQRLVDRAA